MNKNPTPNPFDIGTPETPGYKTFNANTKTSMNHDQFIDDKIERIRYTMALIEGADPSDFDRIADIFRTALAAAQEEGYRRAVEEIDKKIPFLRQWLNEKPIEMLVTDKAIKRFLIPEALQPKE